MKTEDLSVLANVENDNSIAASPVDIPRTTHEEISVMAHQIYTEEGCPDGLAASRWHAAEERLQR